MPHIRLLHPVILSFVHTTFHGDAMGRTYIVPLNAGSRRCERTELN